MSSKDRLDLDFIRDDFLAISEFGDPGYYEYLTQQEEEERQREERFLKNERKQRHSEDEESTEDSIQIRNQSSVNRSRQEAIEMKRKINSEVYRNEHLEKILYESYRKQNAETTTQKFTTEVQPVEEKKKDPEIVQVKVEESKIKKRGDRKKNNAMLMALEERKKKSISDGSTSSSRESVYGKTFNIIDEDDKKKSIVKVLPQTSRETLDVTERFKALITEKQEEENEDDTKDSETSSSTSYYTAGSESGDSSARKLKKVTHTTSRKRQTFKPMSLEPSTSKRQFSYVPVLKNKRSLNLKSKSEFPDL